MSADAHGSIFDKHETVLASYCMVQAWFKHEAQHPSHLEVTVLPTTEEGVCAAAIGIMLPGQSCHMASVCIFEL